MDQQSTPGQHLAIIDMGTNTFHLLIVSKDGNQAKPLYKTNRSVKIGQGGISDGLLTEAAIERALDTLSFFREQLDSFKVSPENVFAFATSAVRSARNGQELVDRIFDRTGIKVNVISGAEEAEYIYHGVKASLNIGRKTSLIADIGGGSVEFIICNDDKIFWKKSFEIGAQRLLDKFMHQDPIDFGSILKLSRFLEDELIKLTNAIHQYQPAILIGSSGTFDTLAEIYYKRKGIEVNWSTQTELELPVSAFHAIHEKIITLNKEQRMDIPGMIEMRVDMIVVASCLIEFLVNRYDIQNIRVSTGSLKEGILRTLLLK